MNTALCAKVVRDGGAWCVAIMRDDKVVGLCKWANEEFAEQVALQFNLGASVARQLKLLRYKVEAMAAACAKLPEDGGMAYLLEVHRDNLAAFEAKYGLCSTPSSPT